MKKVKPGDKIWVPRGAHREVGSVLSIQNNGVIVWLNWTDDSLEEIKFCRFDQIEIKQLEPAEPPHLAPKET